MIFLFQEEFKFSSYYSGDIEYINGFISVGLSENMSLYLKFPKHIDGARNIEMQLIRYIYIYRHIHMLELLCAA